LQPDDFIAVPRIIPVEGKMNGPDHEVIALGHLLAEGNLCHPHSVYYYNQDMEQVNDFVQAANSFTGTSNARLPCTKAHIPFMPPAQTNS
jgi:DNA polymerase-3 subunit alpha